MISKVRINDLEIQNVSLALGPRFSIRNRANGYYLRDTGTEFLAKNDKNFEFWIFAYKYTSDPNESFRPKFVCVPPFLNDQRHF